MMFAGVHLDRAWTRLGDQFGAALRGWSRDVLARVIDEAHARDVGTIVVVGDLLDRRTALPSTVDYAAKVLGTFRGTVVVVPGRSDRIGGADPYSYHDWAINTFICREAGFAPSAGCPVVWASAWTSAVRSPPRAEAGAGAGPRMLVRAGLDESELAQVAASDDDVVVTTGTTAVGSVLTVPDLVRDPRDEGGYAVIVDGDDHRRPAQRVEFAGQPGGIAELDVTGHKDTATLLKDTVSQSGPLLLRLVGHLAPTVLLPGFGGPDLPPGVVLDLDSLEYAEEACAPADRSARAEFLRAMATHQAPEPQRHQTTAVGLAALAATADGA